MPALPANQPATLGASPVTFTTAVLRRPVAGDLPGCGCSPDPTCQHCYVDVLSDVIAGRDSVRDLLSEGGPLVGSGQPGSDDDSGSPQM
jgi:hypothetical protein